MTLEISLREMARAMCKSFREAERRRIAKLVREANEKRKKEGCPK
jgi:hypothetical protein